MKFYEVDAEEPEINLTALIDVVFLLLIFFMVSTTFEQTHLFDVSLPSSEGLQVADRVSEYGVILSLGGQVSIDGWVGQLSDSEVLHDRLRNSLVSGSVQSVVIYADEGASHGQVVALMSALSRVGIESVQVATRYNQLQIEP